MSYWVYCVLDSFLNKSRYQKISAKESKTKSLERTGALKRQFLCINHTDHLTHRLNVYCAFNPLTTNVPRLHRNQSIDLQYKSLDWFLYDGEQWSLMG